MDIYEEIKASKKRKHKNMYICQTNKLSKEYILATEYLLLSKLNAVKCEAVKSSKDYGKSHLLISPTASALYRDLRSNND